MEVFMRGNTHRMMRGSMYPVALSAACWVVMRAVVNMALYRYEQRLFRTSGQEQIHTTTYLCAVTSLQLPCSNAPNCVSTLLRLQGPRFVNVQSLSVLTATHDTSLKNFSFIISSPVYWTRCKIVVLTTKHSTTVLEHMLISV
jgi:hypothetical protein